MIRARVAQSSRSLDGFQMSWHVEGSRGDGLLVEHIVGNSLSRPPASPAVSSMAGASAMSNTLCDSRPLPVHAACRQVSASRELLSQTL